MSHRVAISCKASSCTASRHGLYGTRSVVSYEMLSSCRAAMLLCQHTYVNASWRVCAYMLLAFQALPLIAFRGAP